MTEILEGELVDPDEIEEKEKTFTMNGVAKFIVRRSVKFVVAGVIMSLVPEAETKIQKAKVAIGTYVLADMVAKNTGAYVDDKFTEWKGNFQEVRALVKKYDAEKKQQESETPNP